jgi:hypothetical protein
LQISFGHLVLSGLLLHIRRAPVQLSTVQGTLSSHSTAEQQVPQLAEVPSGLGQHSSPAAHSGTVVQVPALQ